MQLPRELLPPGVTDVPAHDEPVNFDSPAQASEYLRERLVPWKELAISAGNQEPGTSPPATICKETLFAQEGNPLTELLVSGIPELDRNLDKVRLDR